jgi:hypothetical protein
VVTSYEDLLFTLSLLSDFIGLSVAKDSDSGKGKDSERVHQEENSPRTSRGSDVTGNDRDGDGELSDGVSDASGSNANANAAVRAQSFRPKVLTCYSSE